LLINPFVKFEDLHVLIPVEFICWTNFLRSFLILCTLRGKVISVQAVEALRVARGWGSHIFRHSAHRWRQGCQPYEPAAFFPQGGSWYSFLLERVTVQLEGVGKVKKSTSCGTRTGDFPACSIVSQPTTLPRAPILYTLLYNNFDQVIPILLLMTHECLNV
jgi:hypothetical protein